VRPAKWPTHIVGQATTRLSSPKSAPAKKKGGMGYDKSH
jgi:hypothetical protein